MKFITSLGKLRGCTCVRARDEKSCPWFSLDCEKGKWFFEIEYGSLASGSILLQREVGAQGWDYMFHDIRLLATLMPLLERVRCGTEQDKPDFREGEFFPICDHEDLAWRIVCAYRNELNLDIVEHIYCANEWVDADLHPIGCHETAQYEAKLRVLQNVCATAIAEMVPHEERSYYLQLVSAMALIVSRQLLWRNKEKIIYGNGSCWITNDDFEWLLNLRDLMDRAICSINTYVNGQCSRLSKVKIRMYECLLDQERLDALARHSDFAEDLRVHAEMIRQSAANGYRCRVEAVRKYRPSLFPRTCVYAREL